MKKIVFGYVLGLALLISCSKNDSAISNEIAGTWVFTGQVINSFAYPSVLTNPFPIASSGLSTSLDSIKITFDNNGNYTFSNFKLPVDRGTYKIVKDSMLVINPDTAAFVKFNYSLTSVTFSSAVTPVNR